MSLRLGIIPVIFALPAAIAAGQPAPQPAPPMLAPSALVQPALSEVQSSTSALNISKWKAPGSVRDAAQQNVDSILRDLGSTLPGLLAQADAAPASVPQSFAVYRNIDALYDVLLRVSETADLAATSEESMSVAASLQRLQAARAQLGDAILQASQRREAQLVSLAAAARSAHTAPPVGKSATVIDDGPESASTHKSKKKAAPKNPAPPPATEAPSN